MSAYHLRGENVLAYESRERECLLAGAAGTGKSITWCVKMLTLLDKYAGCRGLFCRGTRASLTQSGLVTWERVLESAGMADLARAATRRVRQSYQFPNASELVVAGLDDPGKTLSSEYDFVYIMEATEEGVTLDVYETLLRALRNGKMVKNGEAWHQIFMDCNPTTPTHWLYQRQANGGPLKMYTSTHRDNPAYWDAAANDYTPAGRDYIEGTLASMSGVRRDRFYLGLWKAAEGLVYDGYDPKVHDKPPGYVPPRDWPRVWGIDWGFVNPTALLIAAIDPDGRAVVYKEFYRTHTRAEELARWAKDEVSSGREPLPVAVVCDHDPECAATFNLYGPAGVAVQMADKGDKLGGIEATQERFDVIPPPHGDGKPRLYLVPDMLAHRPDDALKASGKPTGLMGELLGYSWDTRNPNRIKDEPLDANNHSCFVAGTLVETATGAVPIERVRPGDLVLTRSGFRPVLAAGMTSADAEVVEVQFEGGRSLIGTANHPVYNPALGFVRLDALRYCDTVLSLQERIAWMPSSPCPLPTKSSAFGFAGLSIAATRRRSSRPTGTTSDPVAPTCTRGGRTSTATCGLPRTVQFPTGTKSITSTATRSTTASTTYSCFPRTFTTPSTRGSSPSALAPAGAPCRTTRSERCWTPPRSGTGRPPGVRGTPNTPSKSPPTCPPSKPSANSAGRPTLSRRTRKARAGSALTTASRLTAVPPAWTTKIAPVPTATSCSASAATRPISSAREPAPEFRRHGRVSSAASPSGARRANPTSTVALRVVTPPASGGRAAVYNLTVDGCPEYFANGVLVHNCDCLRYMIRQIDKMTQKPAKPYKPPRPGDPFARLPGYTFR